MNTILITGKPYQVMCFNAQRQHNREWPARDTIRFMQLLGLFFHGYFLPEPPHALDGDILHF
jgi:hypothetical protein